MIRVEDESARTNTEKDPSFLLRDFSEESRREFFDYCRKITVCLPSELSRDVTTEEFDDFNMACVRYRLWPNQYGTKVSDLEVWVEEAAFLIDGEDFRDLIPLVVEHEITEAWIDIVGNREKGRRMQSRRGRGEGHKIALLSEFALAHELCLADRYMCLIQKWSKKMRPYERRAFWRENVAAYELTRILLSEE